MVSDPGRHGRHWYRTHRYAILLATLLLVYALYPFAGARPFLRISLTAAMVLMTASAVVAVWRRKTFFLIAVTLGLLVTGMQLAQQADSTTTFGQARLLVQTAFTLVIIAAVLSGVAREKTVTMNGVYGVCAVYLLMALGWSQLYAVLESVEPGSFSRPTVDPAIEARYAVDDNDLLYFSLITMTTVGYGDITPVSPAARTLSSLQGLIGQLFVAIFLARMVSLEVSSRRTRKDGRGDG